MTEYISIRGSNIYELSFHQHLYVHDAILFGKTAIINLDNSKKTIKDWFSKSYGHDFVKGVMENLELLESYNMLYQPDLKSEFNKVKNESIKKKALDILKEKSVCGFEDRVGKTIFGGNRKHSIFVSNAQDERCLNLLLNAQDGIVSTPNINTFKYLEDNSIVKSNAVKFIFKNIPFPSEIDSIQQLIDFKQEGKSGLQYLRLKDFINRLSKEDLSHSELEDRLMLMIKESERDYKQFGIKTRMSNLNVLSASIPDFLDNLINQRYFKAVKNLLSVKESKIKLSFEENKVFDKDIAYVSTAKYELTKEQ